MPHHLFGPNKKKGSASPEYLARKCLNYFLWCLYDSIIKYTLDIAMVTLGVYLLGMADIVYKLNFVESFAFGSLISAVDPVATLAIFQGSRLAV